MSLIYCPECGHEVSNSAVACPNCGRPLATPPPVVEKKVVVARPHRDSGFRPWMMVPIAALGVLLLIVLYVMFARNGDDANSNLRVNVNTSRPNRGDIDSPRSETTVGSATSPGTIAVPNDSQSVNVPGTQTGITSAPSNISGASVPSTPTRGTVVINAKVATRNGQPQAVRNEKFYLLDKDLEMILSDADLEPIEGQSLVNSFGLSVMYPDRYGQFHTAALKAIKDHIKYAGTTDGSGKAQLGSVEPNSYYLFGVTKSPRGFAVWSSPVSIIGGENLLNLAPVQLTEIQMSGTGDEE
jgi:hypothetical protein